MNKEFKVKKFKDTTVYTLESATAGGAGGIASVSKPIGQVQRRTGDNFFTPEDTNPIKPRRGPLRKQTGGGEHKVKTKTIPRKEKHKKPMDMSEDEYDLYENREMDEPEAVAKMFVRLARKGIDPIDIIVDRFGWGSEELDDLAQQYGFEDSSEWLMSFDQGVAEGSESAIQKIEKKIQDKRDALGLAREQRRMRKQNQQGQREIKIQAEIDRLSNELTQLKKQGVAEGRHEFDKKTGQMGYTTADADQRHGLYINGKLVKTYNTREQADNVKRRDPRFKSATIKKIAEDHEIQMASSELLGISKNAKNLLNLVRQYSEQEGLEAWQQSKITKAADYLNSVLQAVSGEQYATEGYTIMPGFDKERYQPRPGLEGPFHTRSGKVVYYDPREGKYYDPDSDFYISHDDWQAMNEQDVTESVSRKNTTSIKKKNKVNEVSRRGFLKGLGAAAVTAANPGGVGKLAKAVSKPVTAVAAEPVATATAADATMARLFQAAIKSGLDFHELVDGSPVPQIKQYAKYQGTTGRLPYGEKYKIFQSPGKNLYIASETPNGGGVYMINYIKDGEARRISYGGDICDFSDYEDFELAEELWGSNSWPRNAEEYGEMVDTVIDGVPVPDEEADEIEPEGELEIGSELPVNTQFVPAGPGAVSSMASRLKNFVKGARTDTTPDKKIAALPAPDSPEFDLKTNIKQKEKVPVGKKNHDHDDEDTKDSYMEHLYATLAEKLDPNAPVDAWVDDFQKANPEKYHQFRQNNKPGTKKPAEYIRKMARAAHYSARTPSRK